MVFESPRVRNLHAVSIAEAHSGPVGPPRHAQRLAMFWLGITLIESVPTEDSGKVKNDDKPETLNDKDGSDTVEN